MTNAIKRYGPANKNDLYTASQPRTTSEAARAILSVPLILQILCPPIVIPLYPFHWFDLRSPKHECVCLSSADGLLLWMKILYVFSLQFTLIFQPSKLKISLANKHADNNLSYYLPVALKCFRIYETPRFSLCDKILPTLHYVILKR